MPKVVQWSKEALVDGRRIFDYIVDNYGTVVARRFNKQINSIVKILADNPWVGPIEPFLANRPIEYHSILINSLNKLVYKIEENRIVVLRIWNMRRSPDVLANQIKP